MSVLKTSTKVSCKAQSIQFECLSKFPVFVVETMDAIDLMNQYRRDKTVFDVVDLDPYGTAIPFLEGSITSLANNGLLCVTFTDMAVLCAR